MEKDKLVHEYPGQCFCGAIQLTVTGAPSAQGFCHCASCRSWSASPVNAFSLWGEDCVKVTKGAELLQQFNKTPNSTRKWCKNCGGHVLSVHPGGLIDVYVATIPTFPFVPKMHVHYAERTLRIVDGLPKQKDMPREFGGSGELIPE